MKQAESIPCEAFNPFDYVLESDDACFVLTVIETLDKDIARSQERLDRYKKDNVTAGIPMAENEINDLQGFKELCKEHLDQLMVKRSR